MSLRSVIFSFPERISSNTRTQTGPSASRLVDTSVSIDEVMRCKPGQVRSGLELPYCRESNDLGVFGSNGAPNRDRNGVTASPIRR